MNPEIKKQWLEALRSGTYVQGRDRLRTVDNKFCCLGVLSDLAVEAGVGQWEGLYFHDDSDDEDGYKDRSMANLTAGVIAWAGVPGEDPVIDSPSSRYSTAAGQNDRGASFEEIADMIEANL